MKVKLFMENMWEFSLCFYFVPYKVNIPMYAGKFFYVFFCSIQSQYFHVCMGIQTSPIKGKYMLDTSEKSHFRPNLSEDLQQCREEGEE